MFTLGSCGLGPGVLHLGGGANVMHGTALAQPSPARAAAHIIQPGTDKVTINCYPAAVRGAAPAHSLSSPSSWSRDRHNTDTAGHRQPAGAAAEQLVAEETKTNHFQRSIANTIGTGTACHQVKPPLHDDTRQWQDQGPGEWWRHSWDLVTFQTN